MSPNGNVLKTDHKPTTLLGGGRNDRIGGPNGRKLYQ